MIRLSILIILYIHKMKISIEFIVTILRNFIHYGIKIVNSSNHKKNLFFIMHISLTLLIYHLWYLINEILSLIFLIFIYRSNDRKLIIRIIFFKIFFDKVENCYSQNLFIIFMIKSLELDILQKWSVSSLFSFLVDDENYFWLV